MAEIIAAVGVTAAAAQLTNYSVGGANGVYDLFLRARNAPVTVRRWDDENQGLIRLADDLAAEPHFGDCEARGILRRHTEEANALGPQIRKLEAGEKDRRLTRWWKRTRFVFKEKDISRTLTSSRHYISLAGMRDARLQMKIINQQVQYLMMHTLVNTYKREPNPRFVVRGHILHDLTKRVDPTQENKSGRSRTLVAGLGGAGKTELAREIAHRINSSCPAVAIFWLNGSTAPTFLRQFELILRLPHGQESDQRPPNSLLVKTWLESNQSPPWLIIIDDVVDDTLFGKLGLHELLPNSPHGRILMLSRNRSLGRKFNSPIHVIDLHGMDSNEARNLLVSYLPSSFHSKHEAIDEIVQRLESFPLGMIQAAGYMSRYNIDPNQYLANLDRDARTSSQLLVSGLMLCHSPDLGQDRSQIVDFDELGRASPLALHLLLIMACLDLTAIPTSIISALSSSDQIGEALSVLKSYSLVKPGFSPKTYDINPFVRVCARSRLSSLQCFTDCVGALLKILASQFPRNCDTINSLRLSRYYSAHVSSVVDTLHGTGVYSQLRGDSLALLVSLVSGYSYFLREIGAFSQMNIMNRGLLDQASQSLSSDTQAHKDLRNHIAVSELCMGNLQTASDVAQAILCPLRQPTLRSEDSQESIRALNTLALSHQMQGKYIASMDCHEKCLAMKKRVLGPNHPDALKTLTNLGICLQSLGKHIAAEGIFRQVLADRIKMLEPDNPMTLRSMNNLATSLQKQKRYSEAEELVRASLEGKIRVFGADHHESIRSRSNLAAVLHYQKKSGTAEREFRGVISAFTKVLGTDHPETVAAQENLASFLREEDRLEEAEETLCRVLPMIGNHYGERNSKTLGSIEHLAILLQKQGKLEAALKQATYIRDIQIEELGVAHASTQQSIQRVRSLERLLDPQKNSLNMEAVVIDERALRGLTLHDESVMRRRFYRYSRLLMAIPYVLTFLAIFVFIGAKLYLPR